MTKAKITKPTTTKDTPYKKEEVIEVSDSDSDSDSDSQEEDSSSVGTQDEDKEDVIGFMYVGDYEPYQAFATKPQGFKMTNSQLTYQRLIFAKEDGHEYLPEDLQKEIEQGFSEEVVKKAVDCLFDHYCQNAGPRICNDLFGEFYSELLAYTPCYYCGKFTCDEECNP